MWDSSQGADPILVRLLNRFQSRYCNVEYSFVTFSDNFLYPTFTATAMAQNTMPNYHSVNSTVPCGTTSVILLSDRQQMISSSQSKEKAEYGMGIDIPSEGLIRGITGFLRPDSVLLAPRIVWKEHVGREYMHVVSTR